MKYIAVDHLCKLLKDDGVYVTDANSVTKLIEKYGIDFYYDGLYHMSPSNEDEWEVYAEEWACV